MKRTTTIRVAMCAFLLQSLASYGDHATEISWDKDTLQKSTKASINKEATPLETEIAPTSVNLKLKEPISNNNLTITQSSGYGKRTTDDKMSHYNFDKFGKQASKEIDSLKEGRMDRQLSKKEKLLGDMIVGFLVESVSTSLVLILVAAVYRKTEISVRLISIAIMIAIISSFGGFILSAELISPIRTILSFIISIPLLKGFAPIRRWSRIIQIAVITRVITVALIWCIYTGASVVFSL